MSFIFLSYSKSQRSLTEALAADLIAQGYEVWWDTSLVSGDTYAHIIRDRLNAAAAVLVIWSDGALNSEWVYSEARRGRNQKKLVQVLSEGIVPSDLPPPFDALHLDALEDRAAILKALHRLKVPQPSPPPAPEPAAADASLAAGSTSRDKVSAPVPARRTAPYVIGLVGLEGAGKTLVGDMLREKGIPVIDIEHETLLAVIDEPGPYQQAVLDRFGPPLANPDGSFSHAGLSSVVEKNPVARRDLQTLLHKPILEREQDALRDLGLRAGAVAAVIVRLPGVVPDLARHRYSRRCDECWHVTSDEHVMAERIDKVEKNHGGPRYGFLSRPVNADDLKKINDDLQRAADCVIDAARPATIALQVESALQAARIRASAAPGQPG